MPGSENTKTKPLNTFSPLGDASRKGLGISTMSGRCGKTLRWAVDILDSELIVDH